MYFLSSKVIHGRGRKKSKDIIQIMSRLYHIIMWFTDSIPRQVLPLKPKNSGHIRRCANTLSLPENHIGLSLFQNVRHASFMFQLLPPINLPLGPFMTHCHLFTSRIKTKYIKSVKKYGINTKVFHLDAPKYYLYIPHLKWIYGILLLKNVYKM
jgi:hypothetical protein